MKKNKVITTLMWIFALIPAVFTAALYRSLPDTMPMHYDVHGTVDRWGSKNELIIIVAIFLAVTAFIAFQVRSFEKKAENTDDEKAKTGFINNAKVTAITGLICSVFMAVVFVFINLAGVKMVSEGGDILSMDATRMICIGMGIMFIVMGNYIPKTRRNSIIGVRCSWTMYNDTTWSKSNRFASYLVVAAGVITVILALAMANVMNALLITVVLMLVICTVSLIYAHKVYVEEVNSGKDRD